MKYRLFHNIDCICLSKTHETMLGFVKVNICQCRCFYSLTATLEIQCVHSLGIIVYVS